MIYIKKPWALGDKTIQRKSEERVKKGSFDVDDDAW
jgi:hypothetical protein